MSFQGIEGGRKILLAVLPALACLSLPLYGLESDKEQNVIYSSSGNSTSVVDGNTRIITIEGDVSVVQGSLKITGDKAVFERSLDSNTINRITIVGTPATYEQQLEADGNFVQGKSDTILYYNEQEPVIELVGAANLQQHNDVLNCESVKYYTDSGNTLYTGPCSGVLSPQ